jgi:hypothetical protein
MYPKIDRITPEELVKRENLFNDKKEIFPETEDPKKAEELAKGVLSEHRVAMMAPHAFVPSIGLLRNDGLFGKQINTPLPIEAGNPANIIAPRRGPGRPRKEGDSITLKRKNLEEHERPPTREAPNHPSPLIHYVGESETIMTDPSNVEEAQGLKDWDNWRKAIDNELDSLRNREVFSNVEELPMGYRAVGHRWVFTKKRGADGKIAKYKARLVAKGFSQKQGMDFEETYAPVIDSSTFLYVLALGTVRELMTEAQDVVTAYLYGKLDHVIYMDAPVGFQDDKREEFTKPVVRLNRALYGLKQAGRMWFQELTNYLRTCDLESEEDAPCLFIKKDEKGFVIVTIYVDD